MLGRLVDDAVQQRAPVGAGVPVAPAPPARQAVVLAGQVGRVADDQVEAQAADRREQVAAQRADAHAVRARVEAHREHRAAREVDGGHLAGAAPRRRHGQHAAAGAQVQHRRARRQRRHAQGVREHPRVAERPEDARRDEHAHARHLSSPALRQTVVPAPGAEALRALFDAPAPLTIGVEDEFMLLDPETLDLVPRAAEVLAAVADDARFKLELPASQLEIVLPPLGGADAAAAALADARAALVAACRGIASTTRPRSWSTCSPRSSRS